MPSMDVFRSDAFGVRSLTDAVLKLPYQPGRIGSLALFQSRSISTTVAQIEEKKGRLKLVQSTPRGTDGETPGYNKRKMYSFTVPHLAQFDKVLADEVQNVRAFGSETETQSVQALINERLTELRAMIEVTLEYHRVKALQGTILDADGSTILDIFTALGQTQQTYEMGTAASYRNDAVEIQRLVEKVTGGMPIGGGNGPKFRAFCGDTFFDSLIEESTVKDALKYQESAILRGDLRSGFDFGGITWENYRGKLGADLANADDESKDVDGDTVSPFIADSEAYVVPMSPGLFRTYFAPADWQETVNTNGLPIYAKQAPDAKWNAYTELQVQSNPLNLVLLPHAVIKVTIGT